MAEVTAFETDYQDLDLKMKLHPAYGDVRPVKDVDAIKGSIKNILLTKRGERPFNPEFGCDLTKYLFEPVDIITTNMIKEEIIYSLTEHEPRVKVNNITVTDDPLRS